ncbi:MAG TPA: ATP-binding protein [Candidatus Thermoplasmatota archaeon]|nr:ATP-binding protein [Candidatus Thermoplasmatota archaeon]
MGLRRQVGIIYGNVSSTSFDIAVGDSGLKRLDYVEVESEGHRVLAQVDAVVRRSNLSYEQAVAIPEGLAADAEDQLSAGIRVIGYQDQQGRIQTPRTPFRAGVPVYNADERLVTAILGLEQSADEGAYLGFVKGSKIPVALSMDTLAQKHLSVLAKTGAGKSYTVGVILEELLKANVPLVILDPHGEYGSLRSPNLDDGEMEAMVRFKVKPKSFAKQVKEYALDVQLNPDAQRLVLEGMNLEGRDIVDLLGGKLSGGQVGVLYQAIKEVKEHLPAYTLHDIMDGVSRNKSNAKWNVLNALEVLESTKVFDIRGTPVKDLVAPGQCTIINLKGVNPDIQEVVVTRIANLLWEARKRAEVPAHILVVEEAHNFCPERNVGNAVSGAIIRTVASEGRKFGMGLIIVSQRPAKIDKNVLSQCNTQVVLKVTNPNDLKAIVQSVEGISAEVADEIQRLAVGEALVAGGGLTQPVFVSVRPRITRHGGRSVSVLHQDADDEEEEEADNAETPHAATHPAPPLNPPAPSPPAPRAVPAWTPAAGPVAAPLPAPRPSPQPPSAPVPRSAPAARDEEPVAFQASPRPRRLIADEAYLAPKVRRTWGAKDAGEIHRVAARIGLVGPDQDPARSVAIVGDLEASHHRDPDERLRLLLEIADNACLPEVPACIRCPEQAHCLFHRALQQERQKTRSPLRRLWR